MTSASDTPADLPRASASGVFRVEGWTWSLDETVAAAHDLLSPDERARAARFVRQLHRDRYIAGRARLRRILATVTGTDPRDLAFRYGDAGKPALDGGPAFNLSHSGPRAVLVVSPDGPLGVDLERHAEIEDAVARHSFSPAEYAALSALPADEWQAGFYRCWTRKEAIIKALGHGLSMKLDSFDVTLAPETPARLLRIEGDSPEAWRLVHVDPGPGWSGAVAARTGGREIVLDWRTDGV